MADYAARTACGELLFVEKLAALMAWVKWVSAGEWQQAGTALGH